MSIEAAIEEVRRARTSPFMTAEQAATNIVAAYAGDRVLYREATLNESVRASEGFENPDVYDIAAVQVWPEAEE